MTAAKGLGPHEGDGGMGVRSMASFPARLASAQDLQDQFVVLTWCARAKYPVPLRNVQVLKVGARRETLPHNRLENNKDTDVAPQNQAQQIRT
jgi:hypothetical protein